MKVAGTILLALSILVACGCAGEESSPSTGRSSPVLPTSVVFSEVAGDVGIDFVHNTGAFGRKWLPETMGSGCAWLDYDLDGDPDALLLSGSDFEGHPAGGRQGLALYRNDDGRFAEVTADAGLDVPLYAMGATHGDFDGDGDPDLYVTALGPNRLYRNDDGRFTDIAAEMGVDDGGFGSSASWLDYDRDGDLDLIALNYVAWTPETDIHCSLDGTNKSYCTPEVYPGAAPKLYRNDGGGFTDVTHEAGLFDDTGKALGVVCFDFDADRHVDVFIANDTQPNFLYRNNGDGTFEEQAVIAGVAFDEAGRARGAMGVDVADYDRSGRPSLIIGNFSNEMLALYHNEGAGFFIDAAPTSDVGRQSLLTLAFGTFFLDFDLDGHQDIFVGNGHVENEIDRVQQQVSYAQPPHLFRNMGGGHFVDVAPESTALSRPIVARGAAPADFDGDGDLDILVNSVGGPARLFRNDGADGSRALRVELVGGAGSNPDGFGAKVVVNNGEGPQTAWVRAGNSYCSQAEKALTFGLGDAATAEVEVTWPSGKISRVPRASAGSTITIRESEAS